MLCQWLTDCMCCLVQGACKRECMCQHLTRYNNVKANCGFQQCWPCLLCSFSELPPRAFAICILQSQAFRFAILHHSHLQYSLCLSLQRGGQVYMRKVNGNLWFVTVRTTPVVQVTLMLIMKGVCI